MNSKLINRNFWSDLIHLKLKDKVIFKTIGSRLIAAFTFIALMVLLVSLVAITTWNMLQNQVDTMIDNNIPTLKGSYQLERSSSKLQSNLNQVYSTTNLIRSSQLKTILYEDLDEILTRLERLGVNVLRSASVFHDTEVQVIGIDDMDDAGQVGRELGKLDVDTDRYVILLYHRPRGLEDAAAAGVDLMLSGHTHNGQIFPFNLIVRRVFEHIVGIYRHGSTTLYVSQGTGTWGPVLRFGTRAEITQFFVTPSEGET